MLPIFFSPSSTVIVRIFWNIKRRIFYNRIELMAHQHLTLIRLLFRILSRHIDASRKKHLHEQEMNLPTHRLHQKGHVVLFVCRIASKLPGKNPLNFWYESC